MRVFSLPTTGDASLDQTTVVGMGSPTANIGTYSPNWDSASMRAIDLDPAVPGGIDELVILLPPDNNSKAPGSLITMRLDQGIWKQIGNTTIGVDAAHLPRWRLLSADLNGDGALDAVVLGDAADSPKITVFWNRRTGALDPAPTTFGLSAGMMPTSIAALNADADPAKELFVLTGKNGVLLAKTDSDGRTITVSPAAVPGLDKELGQQIATGDVTGDGIDDVVILDLQTLHVFKGAPVTP
jgi:hypothetical protein